MYLDSRLAGPTRAELVETFLPVADAARKKEYTRHGEPKRDGDMLQIHLSVRQCRAILDVVARAQLAELARG